jgi:pyridoxine/pyridoxamine 5'-phosphate oxidase
MPDTEKRSQILLLEDLRADYRREALDEVSCETNPFSQFHKWFLEAQAAELKEPNAMSLATATPAGKPSNRIVLLKEASEEGFIFYTSYTSRKGRELETNPQCVLPKKAERKPVRGRRFESKHGPGEQATFDRSSYGA